MNVEREMRMTYSQAKATAYDMRVTNVDKLREAACTLLVRLNASQEDIQDAAELTNRASKQERILLAQK
jgi:hypothetical protein